MYWKSNSKTELGYYGIDSKYHTRLSDVDINLRIAEAFAVAEIDDEEPEDVETFSTRKTTNGEPIPDNVCHVVIENVWIDKFVDLSHDLITKEIGEISKDILDNFDEEDESDESNDMINDKDGRGILNYNIDDLLNPND